MCLRNKEYEKTFLNEIYLSIMDLDEKSKKEIAATAIIKIALNSVFVATYISKSHKYLRKMILSICDDLLFADNSNFDYDYVLSKDFLPDSFSCAFAPFVNGGMANYAEPITYLQHYQIPSKYEKLLQEHDSIDSQLPILFDGLGEYNTVMFFRALRQKQSLNSLDYIVSEFWHLLQLYFEDDPYDEKKDELISLINLLESEINRFDENEVFYSSLSKSEKECGDVLANIKSASAFLYAKNLDNQKAFECMLEVINHSQRYLYRIAEKDIVDFQNAQNGDFYFWNVIDSMPSHIAFDLLVSYAEIVYVFLGVENSIDSRMIHYYQKIAETATSAIKERQSIQKLLENIYEEHSYDCDEDIERFREAIDECTDLINQINAK